jgi:hypothetical protein
MTLIKGIIIDSITGLPIKGANITEILQPKDSPKKIIGRDFEIITTTTPYTLKMKNKLTEFVSLQLSVFGSNLNVKDITPVTERDEELNKNLIKAYKFTFLNGNTRDILIKDVIDIRDFVDDSTQKSYSNSGLTIKKV